MQKLEEKYTWTELAEITADRIEKNLQIKDWNRNHFIKWFMQRENVGYLFDWKMIARCYNISKQLNNESDSFIVVCGSEGTGKSTISAQLMGWISPDSNINDICYTLDQFLQKINENAENYEQNKVDKNDRSLLLDEGCISLFSREAMGRTNKILAKVFMMQRFLNLNIIICIPHFRYLDSLVREHRVKTLVHISERGKYRCITGRGINIVNANLSTTRDIKQIKMGYGLFWDGDFSIRFPKTISKEEYQKRKFENIKVFLKEAMQEAPTNKMIKAANLAKEIGCEQRTFIHMIKKGEIKGRKINKLWYIDANERERLLKPYETPERACSAGDVK